MSHCVELAIQNKIITNGGNQVGLMKGTNVQQAERKVEDALGVFTQASEKVQQAQVLLKESIQQDVTTMKGIKQQIKVLEDKLLILEQSKDTKNIKINENHRLLEKLKEFK